MSGLPEQKGKQRVSEFQLSHASIKLGVKIDEGSFGIVYQAVWSYVNVAVKQLKSSSTLSKEEIEEFKQEGEVMARLRHPNILQFYGYCPSPPYSIVMEHMPRSLYGLLKSGEPLEWKGSDYRGSIRYQIITDVACGLSYLHDKDILHRDLKSRNILLDDKYRAKLGDFGLAKIKKSSKGSVKGSGAGTLAYLAPELSDPDVHYSKRCDIYSLGMTLWEIASRKEPFSDVDSTRHHLIPGWVKEGRKQEKIPPDCPQKLASLIRFCWEVKPERRPTASRIVDYLKSDEEEFKLEEKKGDSKSEGKGDAKQPKSAVFETNVEQLKKLTQEDNLDAQLQLGRAYLLGVGTSKNQQEGQRLIEGVAKRSDIPAGLTAQGICYQQGFGVENDDKKAIECYQKATYQRYAPAQFYLGCCYRSTIVTGDETEDDREALRLFRLSSEQQYAPAQCELGVCYEYGIGVTADEQEAVRWYRLAAHQKHAPAQYKLGDCYRDGTGVTEDLNEARKYYEMAAEQGDEEAQKALKSLLFSPQWIWIGEEKEDRGDSKSESRSESKGEVKQEKPTIFETNVERLKKLAQEGSLDAQLQLGWSYLFGDGTSINRREAQRWLEEVAKRSDVPAGLTAQGLCYGSGIGVRQSAEKAFKCFQKAAHQHYAPAQRNLGVYYARGLSGTRDEREAVRWYRLSAEQQYAPAQNNLGGCYTDGVGVPKDEREAVRWFQLSAEHGYAGAQYQLGSCYQEGRGIAKDEREAVKWYRLAAEQRHTLAQDKLGFCYQFGIGVAEDLNEARKYYEMADKQLHEEVKEFWLEEQKEDSKSEGKGEAKQEKSAVFETNVERLKKLAQEGNLDAQLQLGWVYLMGVGTSKNLQEGRRLIEGVAKRSDTPAGLTAQGLCYDWGFGIGQDAKKAFECFQKAAHQHYAPAQHNLGFCYEDGVGVAKDEPEAIRLYRLAANQGYAHAQTNLGDCFKDGIGVKKDEREAVKWFRLAAEQHYARGQFNLGWCYRQGIGVKKDEQEAVKWCRLSSHQQYSPGQFYLGVYYQEGIAGRQDEREAVKLYRFSAEQEYEPAQYKMGVCYQYGTVIAQDEQKAVKWYRLAAEQGYYRAQHKLGDCYEHGIGVAKDLNEAKKYYEMAAKQGDERAQSALDSLLSSPQGIGEAKGARGDSKSESKSKGDAKQPKSAVFETNVERLKKLAQEGNPDAQLQLGLAYFYGVGTSKNEQKGQHWIEAAVIRNDISAGLMAQGLCYRWGFGVKRDAKKAFECLQEAAYQQYVIAQNYLGFCYQFGIGVAKDGGEAVKWYQLAAKQQFAEAQYRMGLCYQYGIGVTKDEREAVKWYRLSAEQQYVAAQYNMGDCYQYGIGVTKDEREAVKWYRLSAEQENMAAQYNLGDCYRYGIGVTKDEREAVKWYRLSAEQGDAAAQYNLGDCYERGIGVAKDKRKAVELFRLAAMQGHTDAECRLGFCYQYGIGVTKDERAAANWYSSSAKQGNIIAQYNLGVCYQYGTGVTQDLNEARKYYEMAAEQGHEEAQKALDDLSSSSRFSMT